MASESQKAAPRTSSTRAEPSSNTYRLIRDRNSSSTAGTSGRGEYRSVVDMAKGILPESGKFQQLTGQPLGRKQPYKNIHHPLAVPQGSWEIILDLFGGPVR